jgi:hypothetical protein
LIAERLSRSNAADSFRDAAAIILTDSADYKTEQGPGNRTCYGRTSWDMTIEFITYLDEVAY